MGNQCAKVKIRALKRAGFIYVPAMYMGAGLWGESKSTASRRLFHIRYGFLAQRVILSALPRRRT